MDHPMNIKLATPTKHQLAWQDLEMGMFIHYAPNTWQIKDGEWVLEYCVEALDSETQNWRPISVGSAIGHKKIDVINPTIKTQHLRFRCFKSMLKPVIRTFEVYGQV
jgi:alpha-L-fucosidase